MSAPRTSATDPLRVDFVAADVLRLQGRLGMTFAPGKHGGPWRRDLDADVARLRDHYRTDLLLCLVEDPELETYRIPDLEERATAHGIRVLRFPIRDRSVPSRAGDLAPVVARVVTVARDGGTAVVHCAGGLGRTGLVVACCLVDLGHTAQAAIAAVRQARPGTVETSEQEAFVRRLAGP